MNDCAFCSIVTGAAPATMVYSDDAVCAFLDIRPITRGHTLIVPRVHATELDDLDPELGAQIFRTGHRLARALRVSGLASDGANLILNDGIAAFQTIGHVHLHVVPRKHGDKLTFAKGLLLRRPHEPNSTAAAIRAGLTALDQSDPDAAQR